jgi:hypothetical protein
MVKAILSEKKQCWMYPNSWLEIILHSHSNKNSMHWHKNRYVDQWNRIEDPEISPHNYRHLIFHKDAKNIHQRIDVFFNKWC